MTGRFRAELEATNLGFYREVEMIRTAHDIGFFTIVYVFTPEESEQMARAGADCIIAHMGLTVGGTIGLAREGGVAMQLEGRPGQSSGDRRSRLVRQQRGDLGLARRARLPPPMMPATCRNARTP